MQTVVIFDTKFGNTEKVARAIGRGAGTFGEVQVLDTVQAAELLTEQPDLVFVGGPTQRRAMSPGLREFVESAAGAGLSGIATASFDTRYRGSTWIMGSAAAQAARSLGKAGARAVASPESFFIGRGGSLEQQGLENGELERAEKWAAGVARAAATRGGAAS